MVDRGGDPERLSHLFMAGLQHCAIILFDVDGHVLAWNTGAERMYGYSAAYIVGGTLPGMPAGDLAAAAADGHVRREGWQHRSDGARFWAEVVLGPICEHGAGLRGFGAVVRDITADRSFRGELLRRALHDTLTGLPNRALLLDRVGKAISRLERHPEPAALFFVDLDRFKAVNDSLGHRTGDLVLVAVAERLRSAVRSHDTVARLSGDEFVVLCERLDEPAAAAEIATRLVGSLRAPVQVTDGPIALHASIGVVLLERPGREADEVLNLADAAMYQAKRRGCGERIRVAFSAPQPMPRAGRPQPLG